MWGVLAASIDRRSLFYGFVEVGEKFESTGGPIEGPSGVSYVGSGVVFCIGAGTGLYLFRPSRQSYITMSTS